MGSNSVSVHAGHSGSYYLHSTVRSVLRSFGHQHTAWQQNGHFASLTTYYVQYSGPASITYGTVHRTRRTLFLLEGSLGVSLPGAQGHEDFIGSCT